MGVSQKVLDGQRSLVGAVLRVPSSQSLSATLLLEPLPVDPITGATVPILYTYARRLWDGRVQLVSLSEAYEALCRRDAAGSGLRWASALGPLQATLLTLRRIGWSLSGPRAFKTDLGKVLDLMEVSPRVVRAEIEEGLRRWQVRRASQKLTGASSTDYSLLRSVIQGKFADITGVVDETMRGALRRLTSGGLWTRQQLCAVGRALSELCWHCLRQADTPSHRWWRCVGTKVARQAHAEASALAETVSDAVLDGPLFAYGQPILYEFDQEWVFGQDIFEEGNLDAGFCGHVFLDGSGYMPTEPRLRRCGWAVVLLLRDGKWDMERVIYGPLPEKPQTVPHSEHYALALAIDRIVGDTTIYTDCQSVVDYDRLGLAATSSKLPFAGLWRRILARRAHLELQGITVTIVKVLAHQDPDAMVPGSDLQFATVGNAIADQWAKKGALTHALPLDVVDDFTAHRTQNLQVLAAVVGLWVFTLQDGSWVDPRDAQLPLPPPLDPSEAPAFVPEPLVVVQHIMVKKPWGEQCSICRRWARPGPHLERLLGLQCVPMAPGMDQGGGRVHSSHDIVVHTSGVVWCSACGCYADRALKNLADVCKPQPTRFGKSVLRALRRGFHPRTGQPLGQLSAPGFRSSASSA